MIHQQRLDEQYRLLPPQETARRIAQRKAELAGELVILAHHYQRDEIVQFADFVGDSLKLSQQAAATDARYIVFCGVHFMAESADILARPRQAVILPDLSAGCAMAELADAEDVQEALELIALVAAPEKVVPVAYVNSTAAVKAIAGRAGGACCTSSNARNVFTWALAAAEQGGAGGQKILALPDQHLGRNIALAMGYGLGDCAVYDPRQHEGGLSREQVVRAKFILWRGHCYVHQRFHVGQIAALRRQWPDIKVIVHPECPHEVVQAADMYGSTEQILRIVSSSPAGSRWAVGTEVNMVRRLAANNPDKYIRVLSDAAPLCLSMQRIDAPHLLWVLDNLAAGRVVNQVSVEQSAISDARLALERMLAAKPD